MLNCFIFLTCFWGGEPSSCHLNIKYIKKVEELNRGIITKDVRTYINGNRVQEPMAEVMKRIRECK
jgi:hypothetical protein